MRKAAENLEFEEAARLRDEIKRLEAVELAVADDPLVRFIEAHGMQFRLDGYADGDRVSYKNVYTANVALKAADARAVGCLDSAFGWRR